MTTSDTDIVTTLSGMFLDTAAWRGSENEIVVRREWEKRIEEECDDRRNRN